MAKTDKIYKKVSRGSKNIKVSEAVSLLESFDFIFVRETRHTTYYQHIHHKHHIIAWNRNKKILHSKVVKQIKNILDELIEK